MVTLDNLEWRMQRQPEDEVRRLADAPTYAGLCPTCRKFHTLDESPRPSWSSDQQADGERLTRPYDNPVESLDDDSQVVHLVVLQSHVHLAKLAQQHRLVLLCPERKNSGAATQTIVAAVKQKHETSLCTTQRAGNGGQVWRAHCQRRQPRGTIHELGAHGRENALGHAPIPRQD